MEPQTIPTAQTLPQPQTTWNKGIFKLQSPMDIKKKLKKADTKPEWFYDSFDFTKLPDDLIEFSVDMKNEWHSKKEVINEVYKLQQQQQQQAQERNIDALKNNDTRWLFNRVGLSAKEGVVGAVQDWIEGAKEWFPAFVDRVKEIWNEKANNIAEIKNDWEWNLASDLWESFLQAWRGVLQTAGQSLKLVGSDIVFNSLGGLVGGLFKGATTEEERENLSEKAQSFVDGYVDFSNFLDKHTGAKQKEITELMIQSMIEDYQNLPESTRKEIDDYVGGVIGALDLSLLPATKSLVKWAGTLANKAIWGISEVAGNVAKSEAVATATKNLVWVGESAINTAKESLSNMTKKSPEVVDKNLEKAVLKITQWSTADATTAIKGLSTIETKGIKTYKDLSNKLNSKISANSKALDEILQADTTLLTPEDTTKVIKVGNTEVRENFVNKALDSLEELYVSTSNAEWLATIRNIRSEFSTNWLSKYDINNIAKLYGQERNGFNLSGTPSTSLNKQWYENIRKGLKETFRETLPDDTARLLDKQSSNLIQTKDLVDDMVEKVNKLSNKVQNRNVVEKLARLTGKAIDTLTFWWPKAFMSYFLPSNVGLKTMNSLDLEKRLPKLLKEFEKLSKQVDNVTTPQQATEFVSNLEKLQKSTQWNFNKAGTASVPEIMGQSKITVKPPKRTMNADMGSNKMTVYTDKNGNVISQGTHRNIKNYEKTLKKFENEKKTKDVAQYNTIEKLNWLAHNIARKTWDKSIEKSTYKMKDTFAIQEMNRRWPDIMEWDNNKKMWFIRRPDWWESIHVWSEAVKHMKNLRKGKGS